MTPGYVRYLETNKALAECHGLDWNMDVDEKGHVSRATQWSLNQMLEVPPPPSFALSHLGTDAKSLTLLKQPIQVALSEAWQSLIKAAVIEAAYTKKSSPGHIYGTVVRSLKVLATCCMGKEPWEINSNDLSNAAEVAEKLQSTGQLKQTVEATAKTIFDPNHISRYTPILSMKRTTTSRQQKTVNIRASVEERKDAAKLPESAAFWELVRIIYNETPKSFFDAIRFEMIKLMVLLGLRGAEVTTLPLDWRREREYFTSSGQRADESGGIGRSLQVRHFAEKQKAADHRGVLLSPSMIDVPAIFEEAVVDALERVEALTSNIRARLEGQVKGDRIISNLEPADFIEIHELYTALTGEPFLKSGSNEQHYIDSYFKELNPQIFKEIKAEQQTLPKSALKNKVRQYFRRLSAAVEAPLPYRTNPADKHVTLKNGYLKGSYLKVEDAEEIIRRAMPTKLSDTASFNVEGGETLEAYNCLFLAPKDP